MLRLMICGGRQYADKAHVFEVLDRINAKKPITLLIENGDSGVALHAWAWAVQRRVTPCTITAEHERDASDRAEEQALEMIIEGRPNGCVVFPGGAKTAAMVRVANSRNLQIMEVKPRALPRQPGLTQAGISATSE